MAGQELRDARIATVGEIGAFPGVGVRLGKRRRVTIADVVHRIDPWKVGVEGGAIVHRGGRGGG